MIVLSIDAIRKKSDERPKGYYEDVIGSGTVIPSDDGSPAYVAFTQIAFDRLVAKYDPGLSKVFNLQAVRGPGTELKKLLAKVGITATPNCSCNARARTMDERGCDWCEANIDEIVGWLREEAAKRGLPFVDLAGRMLVKRAIQNARRADGHRPA